MCMKKKNEKKSIEYLKSVKTTDAFALSKSMSILRLGIFNIIINLW